MKLTDIITLDEAKKRHKTKRKSSTSHHSAGGLLSPFAYMFPGWGLGQSMCPPGHTSTSAPAPAPAPAPSLGGDSGGGAVASGAVA